MATYLPNVTDVLPDPSLYTPNFSYMDTMLKRRQAMYEQGFAQLNSAYGFVNRSVTNPYSLKVRDEFLSQAKNNLKNLSAMDLSQRQNVDAARKVFEPFVQNKPVLMDMAYTAYMDQQEQLAESDKYTNSGKDYNDWSVRAMRKQRNDFANDDINNVGQYYANRVSYKKYYDWNKEVMEKMKEFKPSVIPSFQKDGMHIIKVKDSSWTKEEISQYLDAVLSDNAKSQMRLEASVIYPDAQSAAGLYANTVSKSLPVLKTEISRLETAMKIEKNPEKRELIKTRVKELTEKSNKFTRELDSISKGDITFLRGNWQNMAAAIYINNKVESLAKGFSHQNIDQDITPDQVAMMYARMAFDREENRKNREAKEEEKGQTSNPISVTREGEKVTTTKESLKHLVNTAQKNADNRFLELKDYLTTQDAFKNRSSSSLTRTEVEEWIKANSGHPEVEKFNDAQLLANIRRNQLNDWDKGAEDYARQQMGEERYKQLTEWRKFAGQKAPGAANRDNAFFQPELLPVNRSDMSRPMVSTNVDMMRATRDMFQENTNINGPELEKQYNDLKNDYNSKVNTVEVSKNTKGFTLSVDNKNYKNAVGYLESISGLNNKVSGVKWFPTLDGYDMTFKIDDGTSKTPIDRKKMAADLKTSLGTSDIQYNEDTDVFTIGGIGTKVSPNLDPFKNLPPLVREALGSIESFAGSPGQKRRSEPLNITGKAGTYSVQIEKLFGTTPETDRYILSINNRSVNTTFETSLDAINTATVLVNSPERLSVILNR